MTNGLMQLSIIHFLQTIARPHLAPARKSPNSFITRNIFRVILNIRFCWLYLCSFLLRSALLRKLGSKSCLVRLCQHQLESWFNLLGEIECTHRVELFGLHLRDMARIQMTNWKWLALLDSMLGMIVGVLMHRSRAPIIRRLHVLFLVLFQCCSIMSLLPGLEC